MSWWLLILVGLNMFDLSVTISDRKYNISFYLSVITFICCCIWG